MMGRNPTKRGVGRVPGGMPVVPLLFGTLIAS
jgi:hypothetical protein